MKIKLLSLALLLLLFSQSSVSQTVDETISFLNETFSSHSIGTTNFSLKKISDNEIVATNSVTVSHFGPEKLTYRFNPKNAVSISNLLSDDKVTLVFNFKENSVEWFDRYVKIETLGKIVCSLVNMNKEEIDKINQAYIHLIKAMGGSIKEEVF